MLPFYIHYPDLKTDHNQWYIYYDYTQCYLYNTELKAFLTKPTIKDNLRIVDKCPCTNNLSFIPRFHCILFLLHTQVVIFGVAIKQYGLTANDQVYTVPKEICNIYLPELTLKRTSESERNLSYQ